MSAERFRLKRRTAFIAVAYAFTVAMLSTTLPSPLYVLYQQQFGFSELTVTLIFATYAAGVIGSLLLFGRLSDEIGRRGALLPGLGFAALSAVVFLVAHGLALLLVGRVLSGLSAGIFTGTATATLLDLAEPERRVRAALVATIASMGGLGCGPLLAGLLAQWAGAPLRLPYWVDLALLLPAAIGIWLIPEPVARSSRRRLRLQALRVPPEIRSTFARAVLASFPGFAVLGLFAALAPAFLGQVLAVKSHAVVGLVVFSVFGASTVGQLALDRLSATVGMQAGCGALIVGMALLALGLVAASLVLLVLGGLVAGAGQGLAFRGGLTAVSTQAPADRRAEVASSFFVIAYLAISLPVVGEGLLAEVTSLRVASLVFVAVVAALAGTVLLLLARPLANRAQARG
jgi:MFS family permease